MFRTETKRGQRQKMAICDDIRALLSAAFDPYRLEVADNSEAHRGHAGWHEGGETHFQVMIRSEAFAGMGRIQRHRAIHAALGPELIGRIHALELDIDS